MIATQNNQKGAATQKSAEQIETRTELAKLAGVSHDTIGKVSILKRKELPITAALFSCIEIQLFERSTTMPKLRKTTSQQMEFAITSAFEKAMIDREWNNVHLAKLCRMTPEKISRAINHPLTHKFETLATIAKTLGMDSLPLK